MTYVALTAARDEADYIVGTLQSMVRQTLLPLRWIVVSDGSSDGTDEIVKRYAAEHPWIELLRLPPRTERHFGGKAECINAAYQRVRELPFEIVANVDADVSFSPDYFAFMIAKFEADPLLGVGGTAYIEPCHRTISRSNVHRYTDLNHVSGQCQVFRRACFDGIGGYTPIRGGAIDWVAVTSARMHGWRTRTFAEKTFVHHRAMGTAGHGILHARFHYGRKAYYVGGHPLWAILRGLFQMREPPWIIGGLLFQLGFFWAAVSRTPRVVSPELMAFHRGEQMSRLKASLHLGRAIERRPDCA